MIRINAKNFFLKDREEVFMKQKIPIEKEAESIHMTNKFKDKAKLVDKMTRVNIKPTTNSIRDEILL